MTGSRSASPSLTIEGGGFLSVRSALARTLRPISVIVGLVTVMLVGGVLRFGAYAAVYYARQPVAGILFWALSLVATGVAMAAGGFVAARLSGPRAFVAALAVGLLEVIPSTMALISGPGAWTWWMNAAYLLVAVFAAAAGGYLAVKRRVRPTVPDSHDASQLYSRWAASRQPADLHSFLECIETDDNLPTGAGARAALVAMFPEAEGQPEFEALATSLELVELRVADEGV
jgi:hypothetical protein